MTKDQFIDYLKKPEELNQNSLSGLREIIADYPYFPLARMLYLRNLRNLNSYKFESELAKHAIYIPDRKMLFKLLSVENNKEFELLPYDENEFKKFFNKELNVENETFDYSSSTEFILLDDAKIEKETSSNSKNDLIDRFISENPTMNINRTNTKTAEPCEMEEEDNVDDGLITETLAAIYVSQGLYSEAIVAFEKLCLKFPEKNSYFATQIEKIKKLI